MGPGDDCAVIGHPRASLWRLLKTDALIEGIHFTPTEVPRRIGRKALSRAVSDFAAMSGIPEHALITIAAPPSTEFNRLKNIYAGLQEVATRFNITIVGGETARSPGPLFINVSLSGSVERSRCILRSGGRPGDLLYVTGRLGGSISGHHLDFIPRLTEARWLTNHFKLHAMMDLSDGLGADLPRLAAASGCHFTLDPILLPKNPRCSTDQALTDGEDYELLFALHPKIAPQLETAWKEHFPQVRLSHIGSLTNPKIPATHQKISPGYDHFCQP